eukprot:Selendium_serpulae@DN3012_c0_g2_i1.p1
MAPTALCISIAIAHRQAPRESPLQGHALEVHSSSPSPSVVGRRGARPVPLLRRSRRLAPATANPLSVAPRAAPVARQCAAPPRRETSGRRQPGGARSPPQSEAAAPFATRRRFKPAAQRSASQGSSASQRLAGQSPPPRRGRLGGLGGPRGGDGRVD